MHPPPYHPTQRLSDWPTCWLEVSCRCGRRVAHPITVLIERFGDRRFEQLLKALRCRGCGNKRRCAIHLCASHDWRAAGRGGHGDWAIELDRAEEIATVLPRDHGTGRRKW